MSNPKAELAANAALCLTGLAIAAVKEHHGASAALEALDGIESSRSHLRVEMTIDGGAAHVKVWRHIPSICYEDLVVNLTVGGVSMSEARAASAH